jgi:hypothetical protein
MVFWEIIIVLSDEPMKIIQVDPYASDLSVGRPCLSPDLLYVSPNPNKSTFVLRGA